MSGYIGTQPVPQATQTRQTFIATAAQTSFATGGYQAGYLDVFLNGVKLQDNVDYTATNGSDIVLTVGAALDDTLEVVAYTAFEVLDQTFTGTTTTDVLTVTGAFTSKGIDDNATATSVTIDANGSLLVGTTDINPIASNTTSGVQFGDGRIRASRADRTVLEVNRKASDGAIIDLYKDSTVVGRIGTKSGALLVESTTCGLWLNGASDLMIATDGAGAGTNGSMDIGSSGNRFKDLYLSGGVYLGGTGAANKLDDYEEGTFTIACNVGTCNSARAVYTKVGDLVTVIAQVNTFSNTGIASNVQLLGLPFVVVADGIGVFMSKGMSQTTEHAVYAAGTSLAFYGTYSGAAYDPLKYTDMTADSEFYLSVTYKTTA